MLRGIAALLLIFCLTNEGRSCTTFCMRTGDRVIFGRNYDFETGVGMVVVNQRGRAKSGQYEGGPRWTSRYGSVTFNQFGREFPMGGMNEKGLVVELMWLAGSRYPDDPSLPPIGVLEWIQYQLDRNATVEEVVQESARVRIASPIPLHYLVSDPSGDSAAIEFLDGKLVVHRGDTLPIPVLANSRYRESLSYAEKHLDRNSAGLPSGPSSNERFTRAASMIRAVPKGKNPVDHAFAALSSVTNRGETRWSIVHDQTRKVIHFITDENPKRRSIALARLNFDCSAPILTVGVHEGAGDMTRKLRPYDREKGRALLRRAYSETSFMRDAPASEVDGIIEHAEKTACAK